MNRSSLSSGLGNRLQAELGSLRENLLYLTEIVTTEMDDLRLQGALDALVQEARELGIVAQQQGHVVPE